MTLSSILDLWGKWNLRGSVILSFSLQVFLTLFASFRKKTTNPCVYYALWLAYLAADAIAIFAIGLISCGQCNLSANVAKVDKAIQAFWASFLVLHLGGPDTLVAFSLEDSSLWKRHLLGYIAQVGLTISLFVQIFLGYRSLLIPTMMVFLAGNIKFVERTIALYLSSLPKLRQSVMEPVYLLERRKPAYDRLARQVNALGCDYSNEEEIKLPESAVVKHAYLFFQIFKVFIVDLIYRCDQRIASRKYFRRISAKDALRVISTEFHFFHETLHTKALAIHSMRSHFFRFIASTLIMVAFVLFILSKKHGLSGDVKITYILLSGGIALNEISSLMFLFSDWTIAKIMIACDTMRQDQDGNQDENQHCSFLSRLLSAMDDLKKPRSTKCKAGANGNLLYDVPNTPFIFRRWSETIYACNLFSEYFEESPRKMNKCDEGFHSSNILIFPFRMIGKVIYCFRQAGKKIFQSYRTCIRRMDESENPFICMIEKVVSYFRNTSRMIENAKYMSKNPFIFKLWIFIFEEVKRKSVVPEVRYERSEDLEGRSGIGRSERTENLARRSERSEDLFPKDPKDLDPEKVRGICEARGNLFLEHFLGEIEGSKFIKYLTETSYDRSIIAWHIATEIWYNIKETVVEEAVVDQTLVDKKEFSKILSDYMLYLLLNQPKVMSAVANVAQITSYEAIEQISLYHGKVSDRAKNVEQLCRIMFEDESTGIPTSSPLLHMGICLAHEMGSLGERKWEVMSGVWVEMLSYAAIHIKGETHMQVLSQGGELLAFVWLLMLHCGLFYKAEWGICTKAEVIFV